MDSTGHTTFDTLTHPGSDKALAKPTDLADIETTNIKQSQAVDTNELELHLRLDKHGLPLVPQPSTYKDDPLVMTEYCCSLSMFSC